MLRHATVCLLLILASSAIMAQSNPTSALGNIRLLPGYLNTSVRPIDSSAVGSISKPHGLVISYDIGLDAGHYENNPQWTKRAVWHSEMMLMVLTYGSN